MSTTGFIILFLMILVILLICVIVIPLIKHRKTGMTPSSINLKEDPAPKWLQKSKVVENISALKSLGFTQGTAYTINEMTGVKLLSFIKQDEYIIAILYQHIIAGVWIDFVVTFEDGEELTVTNAPSGKEIETRPGTVKIFMQHAAAHTLYCELKERMGVKAPKIEKLTLFKEIFEESYQKDMAWRNQRGGATLEEIASIAKSMGIENDDEIMNIAIAQVKKNEIEKLHNECINQYLKERFIRLNELTRNGEKVFVVSNVFERSAFLKYLSEYMTLEKNQWEELKSLVDSFSDIQGIYSFVLTKLPGEPGPTKLGTIKTPIEADIYMIKKSIEF